MPPRYAYWTILVDNQPTAFRAGSQEDLLPTFKRLKEKHPSAEMKWFQNGKLWNSRIDAQEHMRMRGERSRNALSERSESKGALGERGRSGDPRQSGFRARKKPEWTPRDQAPNRAPAKLEWKPKGSAPEHAKPEWRPREDRPRSKAEWKPKSASSDRPKLEWKPKGAHSEPASPKRFGAKAGPKLDWKPRSENREPEPNRTKPGTRNREPGTGARDKTWRPGGAHRDPRQKYKDAKKAKWQRFKKTIRTRWEAKQDRPKKRRDEES